MSEYCKCDCYREGRAEAEAQMLGLIAGLVRQHCRVEDGAVTSGFIGVNADAIDLLCEHGLMEAEPDSLPHLKPHTRGRWAKWKKPEGT